MPTPYGSRGGVAFSADELRVLGGALAIALQSDPAPEEAREYSRLAQAVDDTVREGRRLRSFLLADLARYRDALPGASVGYLEQLEDALTAGYLPRPDDLAALRSLCGTAAGETEGARRLALLHRCQRLAEHAVRARLRSLPSGRIPEQAAEPAPDPAPEPVPGPGSPGAADPEAGPDPEPGADPDPEAPEAEPPAEPAAEPSAEPEAEPAAEPSAEPEAEPSPEPAAEPGAPAPDATPAPGEAPTPEPTRPVPTPAEVFPPRRGPAPPAEGWAEPLSVPA